MGLYVSAMRELPVGDRSLCIYLLDYGWTSDGYENLFRDNFGHLSARASETGSVVVMSGQGVHFANEVLSWHQIYGHDATDILPAILMTHTNPRYFVPENSEQSESDEDQSVDLESIVLIPLKDACTTPDEFLRIIGSIFDDLENGLTLRNFRAEKFDILNARDPSGRRSIGDRIRDAVMLQPNFGGIGVDLKELFGGR